MPCLCGLQQVGEAEGFGNESNLPLRGWVLTFLAFLNTLFFTYRVLQPTADLQSCLLRLLNHVSSAVLLWGGEGVVGCLSL